MKPDAQQCHRIVEAFRNEPHTLRVALSDWREVIQGLRRKGGSYRDIADILGANGVQVSQTVLRDFCVAELGEPIRKRRRKPQRKPPSSQANDTLPPLAMPASSPPRSRARGPRIATLDLLDPSHEQNP
jgi:hypothetical protein